MVRPPLYGTSGQRETVQRDGHHVTTLSESMNDQHVEQQEVKLTIFIIDMPNVQLLCTRAITLQYFMIEFERVCHR